MFRAILDPLRDEDVDVTARPRAILAALCLADEPNVSDEVARLVVRNLTEHVESEDGSGAVITGLGAAAVELKSSQWGDLLGSLLVEEFCIRSVEDRGSFGGLWATISTTAIAHDVSAIHAQMKELKARLSSKDERAAVGAALSVMELAFQGKARVVAGLPDQLLTMLVKDAPSAHASAWALAWLNHENMMGANAWRPSKEDLGKMTSSVGDALFDSEAARYLTWILARERDERSVDALVSRLADANVRQTALNALGQIGNQPAINALVPYLNDDDSEIRQVVLSILTSTLEDETDRALLTRRLDNRSAYLDPREGIDEQRVRKASELLDLSTEEIRLRYKMIAREFPLRLTFESGKQDQP